MTHEAEPTTPNSGRMLDYWLGGQHHYPVDLAGAKVFEALLPDFPRMFRVLRDFIGRTSRYIHAQGVDQFLVLGAGVPTQGNVHEVVPGARVLYTDIDAFNIALGQRILAGVPNTGYTHCDAADPTTLDMAVAERVLGPLRRLGIIMIGVEAFIADEPLRAALQKLYDLAPPGSYLAVDCDNAALDHDPELLRMMGTDFHMRTAEQLAASLGPWQLTEEGIQPVAVWGHPGTPVDIRPYMIGGVARKP
ncbi:SAM-dependent methyltransferase [Polyangium aurulentum]|uniref:SAM-dependent methyltransferase n=1 Tax=Polyangium aurulentum TaxID=2567896 RepID=UPI0010ADFDA0|nr:SAM-dependent methyltransferase [Polyangium aurulentum]UQA55214.1 SAM-dependent methyltransferase [Polyangium aurulentum]